MEPEPSVAPIQHYHNVKSGFGGSSVITSLSPGNTLFQSELELPPDTCQYTQLEGKEILAVGCYCLDEKTNERQGRLLLYNGSLRTDDDKPTLKLIYKLCTSGVLHVEWNREFIALALASGELQVAKASATDGITSLDKSSAPANKNTLALSVSWSVEDLVSQSLSTGALTVWNPCDLRNPCWQKLNAHNHEVWVAKWNPKQPSLLYSGADDCKLKGWDIREPSNRTSTFVIENYTMGITSIEFIPHHDNYFAVGSFDESICIWDIRATQEPIARGQVGGGVWRIKWNQMKPNLIATACMSNHFQILYINDALSQFQSLCTYKHGSLAYGIDWKLQSSENNTLRLASCSFYDKILSLWESKIE